MKNNKIDKKGEIYGNNYKCFKTTQKQNWQLIDVAILMEKMKNRNKRL